ncbi:hypothetical protein [Photobacterium damselae]|uniref:hypothetical protein n=1 Tax=Photobacterium damselae TaxID=38293 RepID=UPI00083B29CA|nr:hypothetical protein [Photobacterium damselae]ODA24582.1 hypothetical protein A0J46_16215 [Photobacterium damselae subsp. damselae]
MDQLTIKIFEQLLSNGTGIETVVILFLGWQLVGLRKSTDEMASKLTEAVSKLDKRITILEVKNGKD